jgi:hypothetical protein
MNIRTVSALVMAKQAEWRKKMLDRKAALLPDTASATR